MTALARQMDTRLKGLSLSPPRRLRHVQQMTSRECGLACLAMVLGYHGRDTTIDELRAAFGDISRGVSAVDLIRVAERFGLRARAYRVDVEDLAELGPGTILHWNFNHWVVLERRGARSTRILDPDGGKLCLDDDEVSRALTGVAIEFEPKATFQRRSTRRRSPLLRYFRVLTEFRGTLANALVLSVFMQLVAFGPPLAFAIAVEDMIPRGELSGIMIAGVALGLLTLGAAIASFVRGRVLLALASRLDARFTVSFVEHLSRLSFAFLGARSVGDLMQRVTSVRELRAALSGAVISSIIDAGVALSFLVALFAIDGELAIAIVTISVAQIAVVWVSARRRQRLMSKRLVADGECQDKQVELLANIETLKAMGREDSLVEQWSAKFVAMLNADIAREKFDIALETVRSSLRSVVPALLIGVAGLHVAQGELSIASLFALSAIAPGFLGPMSSLAHTVENLSAVQSVAARINDVFDQREEQDTSSVHPVEVQGRIAARDLCFSYGSDDQDVLSSVCLEVEPGQMVGIVGPSGCGKSTLLRCLVHLCVPQRGDVCIDGHPLRSVDIRHLRRQIGYVGQEPRLFSGSVKSNILLGAPDADEAAVRRAAELAGIARDIEAMPMGYDTLLPAGGSTLSGGQRQRLAIARALVGQPRLVLFDEATSALDSRVEQAIQRALASLDCTRVVVAHRLSTVRDAELILVMDRGRVVERGTHDQLVALRGLYASLWRAQQVPRSEEATRW